MSAPRRATFIASKQVGFATCGSCSSCIRRERIKRHPARLAHLGRACVSDSRGAGGAKLDLGREYLEGERQPQLPSEACQQRGFERGTIPRIADGLRVSAVPTVLLLLAVRRCEWPQLLADMTRATPAIAASLRSTS